jgi:hypothetical protein
MRLLVIGMAGMLSSGCERPSVSIPAPQDAAAEPTTASEPDPYAAYEFPPITDDWGAREYAKLRDVLIEIEREQPDLLVTLAGRKRDVLGRIVSLDRLTADLAGAPDMDAVFEINEAVGAIFKLYAGRVAKQQPYGLEVLLLTAAMLRSSTIVIARLTTMFDEATLRAEPIRREGLLQARHGLVIAYVGALETPLQLPAIVDPRVAVALLEPIAADVAPFLLPDERQTVEQLLTALAGAGADAAQVAATRASIAAASLDPRIAAFAVEAKAYSDKQRQMYADVAEQQRPAVELGREQGGVRYGFPEAGFSAVFHQRPNAMLSSSNATDGVPVTMRVLGIRDTTNYSTTIVCVSRPEPRAGDEGGGSAREVIEKAKVTDLREVEIDGRRGFEGTLTNSMSVALTRTVDLDRGLCMITVEYPPHLADSYEQQARAFLDSVELGGFEG